MTQLAEERMSHASNYQRFEQQLAAKGPAWLDELRKAGMARFNLVGFPASDQEEWRFTNISPIVKTSFELAGREGQGSVSDIVSRYTFGNDASSELVFVNGHYVQQFSKLGKLPRGVRVTSLADAMSNEADAPLVQMHLGSLADIEKNPFVALNSGFIGDGAFVHLAKGAVLDRPIHLLFVSTANGAPSVSHPRVLVVAEENSEGSLVESYVGDAGVYFTNAVTEIAAADSARLDHNKLQQESIDAFHVATLQVQLGRSASFVSHSASLGSRLTRNDLNVIMGGNAAEATLNGLVIINGSQHIDNHTLLDHAMPNCPSHELYKHVLSGKSTGVFKGKILVRKDAQKTDSKQTSKSLLLSDDADMNSQPALEIYADDVKCTHGSTIGPVDEDMVFYLRSRGVSLEASRHILSYAFAADITRRIRVEPVRRRLEEYMAAQHGLPKDLRITDLGRYDEAHR